MQGWRSGLTREPAKAFSWKEKPWEKNHFALQNGKQG